MALTEKFSAESCTFCKEFYTKHSITFDIITMPRNTVSLCYRFLAAISQGGYLFLVFTAAPVCSAFTAPSLRVSHIMTASNIHCTGTCMCAHLPPFRDGDFSSAFSSATASSLTLATAASGDDISMDDAFQDSISFTDGPIGVLVAAFAVFVVLAVGLKAVMSEMDSAIEKVLKEFEVSLKRYYPKRWEAIEETSLAGLSGDERDIKLLKVMEELQRDEPEFMTKLANRSGRGPGDANA